MLGNEKERLNALMDRSADIYLINYENLGWLTAQLEHFWLEKSKPLPFDIVVWDEVSKMKNSTTARGKAVVKLLPHIKRAVGLTGTPCSNGLPDLHGQYLVVDKGERLGWYKSHFKTQYGFTNSYSHRWEPFPDAQRLIEARIHDITLQMSAEDYLEMKPFIVNDVYIQLPPELRRSYDQLEQDMITQLDADSNHHEIIVFNAGSLTNKCLQFANGAVYKEPENPEYVSVHDLKLDALSEIVEGSGGDPIMVAYTFRSDRDKILKKFPKAVCLSDLKGAKLEHAVSSWNAGNIPMIVGHPDSMGHGLNLQHGGHTLVWFGLNWSLDLYDQFNARLHRQGQAHPVICHRIMVQGTVEQVVRESLEGKATTQDSLREAISRYADTKRTGAKPPPQSLSFL
jgi:SNF2 family DNA or RNA helicase